MVRVGVLVPRLRKGGVMLLSSRDLQERLEELEDADEPLDESESAELEELRTLAGEVTDWQYGETLIPVDDFTDYARELAFDLGYIRDGLSWPFSCIDWEEAADQLKQDYSEHTYQGTTYLVRN